MNSRFRKLGVESLECRSVLSTTWVADFNNDGWDDVAAITDPNTITVSLFDQADGSYDVSAILKAPKNQTFVDIYSVADGEHDGDLDIYAIASKPSGSSQVAVYQNNGDGTFNYIEPVPVKWHGPRLRGF